MNLDNKVALVTGASRGIGRAIALDLARRGARVVVNYHQNAEAAAEVVAAIQANGGEAIPMQADVGDFEQAKGLITTTLDTFGQIDILVNNAGTTRDQLLMLMKEDDWDTVVRINLKGVFNCCKAAARSMMRKRQGRIINMASIHGLVASPFKIAYVTAKHGLIGLTREAALEGGAYGITVNAICPAYVRTPLVESQIADQALTRGISPQEVIEHVMLEPAAVKRLIEPEEVAALVVYLCSEVASVVTGAAWTIDLGWTAR